MIFAHFWIAALKVTSARSTSMNVSPTPAFVEVSAKMTSTPSPANVQPPGQDQPAMRKLMSVLLTHVKTVALVLMHLAPTPVSVYKGLSVCTASLIATNALAVRVKTAHNVGMMLTDTHVRAIRDIMDCIASCRLTSAYQLHV